jgi:hypothetical protein
MDEGPLLLSVGQTARLLGLSLQATYRLCHVGDLAFIRDPRIRVEMSAIRDYISARREPRLPAPESSTTSSSPPQSGPRGPLARAPGEATLPPRRRTRETWQNRARRCRRCPRPGSRR